MKNFLRFGLVVMLVFTASCSENSMNDVVLNDSDTTGVSRLKASYVSCWCLTYIQNKFKFEKGTGYDALDYGVILKKKGYSKKSTPSSGDIVIFQPEYGNLNPTYGHIGVITNVQYVKKGKEYCYYLKVKGARQGGDEFNECGCNNISYMNTYVTSNRVKYIAYWRK